MSAAELTRPELPGLEKFDVAATDHPAGAFRLAAPVEFGSNGSDAASAPFRMLARSSQPITHWYWGRIVHNLSGARVRGEPLGDSSRINIDYGHDPEHVIGYGNRFEIDEAGLWVSGALTPLPSGDRGVDFARRVIHLAGEGVPYEGSINFAGDDVELRYLEAGEVREVNGFDFAGPGLVVETWPLRNVAVVPLGADGRTETMLLSDAGRVPVVIRQTQPEKTAMSQDTTAAAAPPTDDQPTGRPEELAAVDPASAGEAAGVDPDAAGADSAEAGLGQPAVDAQPSRAEEGRQFMEEFGDRAGSLYFASGLSLEDARRRHIQTLTEENARLRQRLEGAAAASGEESALSGDVAPGHDDPPPALVPRTDGSGQGG